MSDVKTSNSRILHIIPYGNLFPPKNGGQLRCFHLMDELSKYYQLDVLCYQAQDSFSKKGYVNNNISFYNADAFAKKEGLLKYLPNKIKNALRYRLLTKTLFQSATSEVLEFSHIIQVLSKRHKYDMVVFEHLTGMSLTPIVKKQLPQVKRVLDAHNVDHLLIAPNHPSHKQIKKIESELDKYVDEFWACSQNDVNILETLNNGNIKGKIVPNGVSIKNRPYNEDKNNTYDTILFCGTLDAMPNKEGLLWFYKEIWPLVLKAKPNVKLLVVGKGNRTPFVALESDPTVDFVGEVEEVNPYYKKSFIAIVPLLSGSGTRLKVLEAMSLGNPLVTTSKGIEGIEFKTNTDALLADNSEAFASSIIQILNNPEKGEALRKNAYELVTNKYDWGIIVRDLMLKYNLVKIK